MSKKSPTTETQLADYLTDVLNMEDYEAFLDYVDSHRFNSN